MQGAPERASRFIAEIREIELSDEIKESVRGYETVGHRNLFLWKWVRRGVEITTLSSVEESLWDSGNDTKPLGVVLDVLLLNSHRTLPLRGTGAASFFEFRACRRASVPSWS